MGDFVASQIQARNSWPGTGGVRIAGRLHCRLGRRLRTVPSYGADLWHFQQGANISHRLGERLKSAAQAEDQAKEIPGNQSGKEQIRSLQEREPASPPAE